MKKSANRATGKPTGKAPQNQSKSQITPPQGSPQPVPPGQGNAQPATPKELPVWARNVFEDVFADTGHATIAQVILGPELYPQASRLAKEAGAFVGDLVLFVLYTQFDQASRATIADPAWFLPRANNFVEVADQVRTWPASAAANQTATPGQGSPQPAPAAQARSAARGDKADPQPERPAVHIDAINRAQYDAAHERLEQAIARTLALMALQEMHLEHFHAQCSHASGASFFELRLFSSRVLNQSFKPTFKPARNAELYQDEILDLKRAVCSAIAFIRQAAVDLADWHHTSSDSPTAQLEREGVIHQAGDIALDLQQAYLAFDSLCLPVLDGADFAVDDLTATAVALDASGKFAALPAAKPERSAAR